jgi:hypothetical protein
VISQRSLKSWQEITFKRGQPLFYEQTTFQVETGNSDSVTVRLGPGEGVRGRGISAGVQKRSPAIHDPMEGNQVGIWEREGEETFTQL